MLQDWTRLRKPYSAAAPRELVLVATDFVVVRSKAETLVFRVEVCMLRGWSKSHC